MLDNGTLAQIASIIAGFGAAMLYFRIQRELHMGYEDEPVWIPLADRLLILATVIALIGVVIPLVVISSPSSLITTLARASCAAATIMLTGYIPSILAHYRLLFGKTRSGPRQNPEPAEKNLVRLTVLVAIGIAMLIIFRVI